MAGEGENRCHGTCQVGPRPVDKNAQAWDAISRPQTNCESSSHHGLKFGPTPEEHRQQLAYDLAHFEALLLVVDAATNKPETKPLPLIVDDVTREEYRALATGFEEAISRIFVLRGSTTAFGVDSHGKRFEIPLKNPATPVLNKDGDVVAYHHFQREGGIHYLRTLGVDGKILEQAIVGEDPLEDSIVNDLVETLATAGLGSSIKIATRAVIGGIARGGLQATARTIAARAGEAIAKAASAVIRSIAAKKTTRIAARRGSAALLGRVLTETEQAAFDRAVPELVTFISGMAAGSGKKIVTVEGVKIAFAGATMNGTEMIVHYNIIENTARTPAFGRIIHHAFEKASVKAAQQSGARTVRVEVRDITDKKFLEFLKNQDYTEFSANGWSGLYKAFTL